MAYALVATAGSRAPEARHPEARQAAPPRTVTMRQDDEMAWVPTKGRLLLAAPALADPNFDRTVIYILEHNTDGALGLVLNRPGKVPAAAALPAWAEQAAEPSMLFYGGPVEPGGVIGLGRPANRDWPAPIDLSEQPALHDPQIDQLRLFNGYAGWDSRQLESELAQSAWIVLDAEPADIFTADPAGLWRAVLRRQPGRLAWLATFPDDIAVN